MEFERQPRDLYVRSIALPTRSASTITTAATPSPSAPNARPPPPRRPARHRRRSREQALRRDGVAAVGLHHGDGLVKPCWCRVSVTLRPPGLAEIPILASRHSKFEGPRTTFRIQRGGCWIATVIDSSTTEGGYMAKPWAALPVSGSVILGS